MVRTIQQTSNSSRKGLLDRAPTLEPISVRRHLLRKTSSQTTEPCPLVEGMSVSSSVSPSRSPLTPARSQILARYGVPSCDRREETRSSTHCVNELVGPITVDETSMLMQKTTPDTVVRHMSSGEIVEALLSPGPAWFATAKWPHAAGSPHEEETTVPNLSLKIMKKPVAIEKCLKPVATSSAPCHEKPRYLINFYKANYVIAIRRNFGQRCQIGQLRSRVHSEDELQGFGADALHKLRDGASEVDVVTWLRTAVQGSL